MAAAQIEKKNFTDYVRVHAINGEVITREDEAKILKEGITQFGLDLNEARGTLLAVAAEHDIVLVSTVEQQVATLLEHVAHKGRISRKQFKDAVAIYKRLTRGRISERDIAKRVKQLIEDRGWRPRRSRWLIGGRRWFRKI
jgi:hypothetical protein